MPQVVFQQGLNGYSSTFDTMLTEYQPNKNYASATSFSVDDSDRRLGNRENQALLQFADLIGADRNQVPAGATITKATLTLETTNGGNGAALYRMLTPWDENSTWTSLSNGIQADGTEAAATADFATGRTSVGITMLDVTTSVQDWAKGAANYGWAFLSSGNNGWDFASSEGGIAPRLTVEYTVEPGTPGDTAPVAADDSASTTQSTPVAIAVLANDIDPNGDAITISGIAQQPAHGSATINPDGTITYAPAASYLGDDSFSYTISDGQGSTDAAVVNVTVGQAVRDPFSGTVSPKVETAAVAGSGDVADDPAIWVDRTNPSRSVVIGTDKDPSQGRLYVFDLDGNVITTTTTGQQLNNVDLRYGFNLDGRTVDLVGASNRATGSIDFFALDPDTRELTPVGSVATGLSNIYGFTMGQSSDGKYYAFVSNTAGGEDSSNATTVRQFELDGSSGQVSGIAVRTFSPGTQVEGMVVDDQTGTLYLAEEDVGIWKYGADPASGSARTQVDAVGGGRLTADVEGLTIYYGPNGTGYLIASSQGSDSYTVYARHGSNSYLGSFRVNDGNGIDRATDTDGLDVTNLALGSAFPTGMLVVHDHSNTGASSSNFKLVPWNDVAALGGLITNTTYDGWLL
jgi:myo-inositol-hexaphosphate 3-phosphohydrolase